MELILNSTEKILLYDIRTLLIEQNELLKEVLNRSDTEQKETVPDLDTLKRGELLAEVKKLPTKPSKWSLLSNDELKTLIKEGEKKCQY